MVVTRYPRFSNSVCHFLFFYYFPVPVRYRIIFQINPLHSRDFRVHNSSTYMHCLQPLERYPSSIIVFLFSFYSWVKTNIGTRALCSCT